jgi:type II secretory pathway pseudopilin PulG
MANRSGKFALVIIASLLAGAPITIFTSSFAHAGRECQTKPGSETRQGQQWRYRTEHGTKRRCWFLTAMSGSIANAHDELPLPGVQQDGGASAAQRARANIPSATDSVPPVAPRWPEPLVVNSSVNPVPEASATVVADANPTPQADPSPALAPVTLAETPAPTQKTATFQMLLLVILGTLALASLTEEIIEEFLVRLSKLRQSDMERLLLR